MATTFVARVGTAILVVRFFQFLSNGSSISSHPTFSCYGRRDGERLINDYGTVTLVQVYRVSAAFSQEYMANRARAWPVFKHREQCHCYMYVCSQHTVYQDLFKRMVRNPATDLPNSSPDPCIMYT